MPRKFSWQLADGSWWSLEANPGDATVSHQLPTINLVAAATGRGPPGGGRDSSARGWRCAPTGVGVSPNGGFDLPQRRVSLPPTERKPSPDMKSSPRRVFACLRVFACAMPCMFACLRVSTREMPSQPHPPCEKCRLAASAPRFAQGMHLRANNAHRSCVATGGTQSFASEIGRNKMRPSRDWRKSHQCASLMRGNGDGRPTVGGSAGRLALPCAICVLRPCVAHG